MKITSAASWTRRARGRALEFAIAADASRPGHSTRRTISQPAHDIRRDRLHSAPHVPAPVKALVAGQSAGCGKTSSSSLRSKRFRGPSVDDHPVRKASAKCDASRRRPELQGRRTRRVGDDDRARRALHIDRLENPRAELAVRIPENETQGVAVGERHVMGQNVDADRRPRSARTCRKRKRRARSDLPTPISPSSMTFGGCVTASARRDRRVRTSRAGRAHPPTSAPSPGASRTRNAQDAVDAAFGDHGGTVRAHLCLRHGLRSFAEPAASVSPTIPQPMSCVARMAALAIRRALDRRASHRRRVIARLEEDGRLRGSAATRVRRAYCRRSTRQDGRCLRRSSFCMSHCIVARPRFSVNAYGVHRLATGARSIASLAGLARRGELRFAAPRLRLAAQRVDLRAPTAAVRSATA